MLDSETGPWSQLFLSGAEKTWRNDLLRDDLYFRYMSTGTNYASKLLPSKLLNGRLNSILWPIFELKNYQRLSRIQVQKNGQVLQIDTSERWSSIAIKTLVAFKYCLENWDFDFIVRGNATAYFNVIALRDYLENCQSDYVGPIQKNKPFASGWSMGLSREAATYLLDHFSFHELSYFDDEAFGKVLTPRFGCQPMPFFEISSPDLINGYSQEFLRNFPVIRTKAIVGGNRIDYLIQQKLYSKIKGNRQV